MKKVLLFFLLTLLILILSIFLFSRVYEERLIGKFKKEIIDKTNINIDFEEVHFSLLRYFPYGSFTLDNAKIFYSIHNKRDTLLNSKKLSFKINTTNLFKSIYEFPEIIISDGSINLKGELIDTLFKNSNAKNQSTSYLIDTKSIIISRCKIKYNYKKTINFNLYTKESSFSGSFLPNSLLFRLDLNINQFAGCLNGFNFTTNDFIKLSSIVKQQSDTYLSESGKITKGKVDLGFSFLYNTKDQLLQIKTRTEKISAKTFYKELLKGFDIPITKGNLSYESFYSINFNVSKSQKLTLKYNLYNISLEGYENLSILNLKGKTTFTNDFNKNHSEVENFSIHYNGFELIGSSMIKNFPQPSILIDSKVSNLGEIVLSKKLSINGNFKGKIKALIKIDDINKLEYKYLKINKIQSELTLSNISIKNISSINSISGILQLNDDILNFKGKGTLFNEEFKGTMVLPDFMNIAFQGVKPSPKIYIEMDRLNLDSALMVKSSESNTSIDFELKSSVKSLKYKDHNAADLEINLTSKNGWYNCDYFKIRAFKGLIAGSFAYSNGEYNNLSITGQGLDIQNLFRDFENFGQSVVTAKNISGSISGKVDMSYKMLNDNKIDLKSIKMASNIIIENGKLSGVGQLKRLAKFLNISEVDSFRFKTIQNKIDIENGTIKIPSMDIASNALNFQVSGKHGFDGEFTYWVKLNLKEILAKKYLLKNNDKSGYEYDKNNGLNLFLKIYGNNESYKMSFDKKSSIEHFKSNLNQEGVLLKSILKEEFGLSKKKGLLAKDSTSNEVNKVDSIHNKNQKKPFKIEWDEIDTTKNNNQ